MSSIDIDVTEILALASDFSAAADQLVGRIRPVVQDGAAKIKATMQADMEASAHFGQVASAIGYNTAVSLSGVEAQIGPATGSPGSLANIAYFGGAHGGGGTVRDPLEAAEQEAPGIERALTAIIGDPL